MSVERSLCRGLLAAATTGRTVKNRLRGRATTPCGWGPSIACGDPTDECRVWGWRDHVRKHGRRFSYEKQLTNQVARFARSG